MEDSRLGRDRKCREKLSLPVSGQRLSYGRVDHQGNAMLWVSIKEWYEVRRRCDSFARLSTYMKPQVQNPSTP